MNSPLITVLMTVYNGDTYLSDAIESILNQTYINFEFLIIDDASTDGSENIILSFNDNRIRYIKNETNIGQTASLNLGLKLAKGKYIARIDQDDLSSENRLHIQCNYMEKNKNICIVGSWVKSINENNEYICTITHPTDPHILRESIVCGCPISHSSVFFDRKKILKIGGYPVKLKYAMDWGLWIECIKNNYTIVNIPIPLASIRTHSNNFTSLKKLDLIKFTEQYQLFYQSNTIAVKKSTGKYANGLKNYLGLKLFYLYLKKGYFTNARKVFSKLTSENVLDIIPVAIKKIQMKSIKLKGRFKIEPISRKYYSQ